MYILKVTFSPTY